MFGLVGWLVGFLLIGYTIVDLARYSGNRRNTSTDEPTEHEILKALDEMPDEDRLYWVRNEIRSRRNAAKRKADLEYRKTVGGLSDVALRGLESSLKPKTTAS